MFVCLCVFVCVCMRVRSTTLFRLCFVRETRWRRVGGHTEMLRVQRNIVNQNCYDCFSSILPSHAWWYMIFDLTLYVCVFFSQDEATIEAQCVWSLRFPLRHCLCVWVCLSQSCVTAPAVSDPSRVQTSLIIHHHPPSRCYDNYGLRTASASCHRGGHGRCRCVAVCEFKVCVYRCVLVCVVQGEDTKNTCVIVSLSLFMLLLSWWAWESWIELRRVNLC